MLGVGVEPPPDSTEPSLSVAIWLGSPATAPRSACVIWPIFSSSVMRLSRSLTRFATGWAESRYAARAALQVRQLACDWGRLAGRDGTGWQQRHEQNPNCDQ